MREKDNRALARLANRQFGVLRLDQLFAAGLDKSAISRRVRSGQLTRLYAGIYAFGHRRLRDEGRWLAAWWACGADTVVSHTSALACLGHGTEKETSAVHISTDRAVTSRRGLVVHRVKSLHPLDVCELRGIRTTTIPRTVIDLADVMKWDEFRAVADQLPVLHLEKVLEAQERAPGRKGAGMVRRLIEADQAHTKSEFERRYLRFCKTHSLARPDDQNVFVARQKADCVYDSARLIVELDGRAFHARRSQMRTDRQRDRRYQLAGYRICRLVWDDLHRDEAAATASELREFLGPVA